MLLEPTLVRLRELRLTGMADALEEQRAVPDIEGLSFEDRLGLLVEREATVREDRRLTRLLRQARLRLPASIEALDLRAPRGLDRSYLLRLASGDWIRHHEVVLITGATGTGKTFLACALAQAACRHGLASRYFRLSRLLQDLALARADGSYPKLMDRLQKTRLLALDDFGLAPLDDAGRRDLLEVLEDRVGRRDPRPDRSPRSPDHRERRFDASTKDHHDIRVHHRVIRPGVASLRWGAPHASDSGGHLPGPGGPIPSDWGGHFVGIRS